jgi:hypothetical protein
MATHKKHPKTRPLPPANPGVHAHKIADAVAAAWHGTYGSGRLDVPVCVVATIAAAPQRDVDGLDSTDTMLAWTVEEFITYSRMVWTAVIRSRPELVALLYPLVAWIFENPTSELREQAHAVAMAAVRAGEVDLAGTDRRFDVDLLGTVLTVLRTPSALKERGQFYTPPDVADLLARMSNVEEASSIEDPTMGTGGMFRAAAAAMRAAGRDPQAVQWVGCDIDEMAVACAVVNSLIWGLGDDILFYAGSTFAGDWKGVARAQRDELRNLAANVDRYRKVLDLLRTGPNH